MTTTCSFCKTEYAAIAGRAAKCPLCGRPAPGARAAKRNPTPRLFVAAAMFLLTGIFTTLALKTFDRNQKSELLRVSISSVRDTSDGYEVRGNIRNFSENTYSIPDLVFVLKTESGIVLNRITELPPGGLIEPMSDVEFVRRISPKAAGATKVSVEFAGEE